MSERNAVPDSAVLGTLTGPIRFRLTNSYMFVAVLHKNHEALCHLIAALLHIRRSDISDVKILNPIVLGEDVGQKDIVLDLRILLNNNTVLNLEMQVNNEGNWDDRSLYYLSKNLVLAVGEDYTELKPVIQIGILDFNYPSDNTEFYQKYVLMNRITHRIFSDKLAIHVLCLSQIENAREEDLYDWARVFKATTWEELKALSENNHVIAGTAVTMAELSENEKIKEQLLREEKAERDKLHAQKYGYRRGLAAGFIEGHEKGFSKGFSDGHKEGFSDGRREGFSDGRREGFSDGQESLSQLIRFLIRNGRQEEIAKVASDPEYRQKLLSEFQLLQGS